GDFGISSYGDLAGTFGLATVSGNGGGVYGSGLNGDACVKAISDTGRAVDAQSQSGYSVYAESGGGATSIYAIGQGDNPIIDTYNYTGTALKAHSAGAGPAISPRCESATAVYAFVPGDTTAVSGQCLGNGTGVGGTSQG